MSASVRDEDREMLLSLYLDGELDAERRLAVEEKLRDDPAWQADFEAMRASEQRVSKAVQANWHDAEFTDLVMEKVTRSAMEKGSAPDWAGLPPLPPEDFAPVSHGPRRLVFLAMAAALLLLGITLSMFFRADPKPPENRIEALGEVDPEAVKFTMNIARLKGKKAGEIHPNVPFTVTAPLARIEWHDGTVFWARKDAQITALSARKTKVSGTVLVEVAKGTTAYEIPYEGSTVAALGTRFELSLPGDDPRVRVLEGRVRVQPETGAAVEVRGGEQVTGTKAEAFDPREVLAAWREILGTASPQTEHMRLALGAPWPQVGGNPGHTGRSPLHGPAGLSAKRFFEFPGAAAEGVQQPAAVVGAGDELFLLRRTGIGQMQLYGLKLSAAQPVWKKCGEVLQGGTQHAPVITPRGLVVAGTTANWIQAWDAHQGAPAWKQDLGASIYALCAGHDGRIYASTHTRLVALNEAGEIVWAFEQPEMSDLQAPAAVGSGGEILIVSRSGRAAFLDREGKVLDVFAAGPAREGVFWPPVEKVADGFWITANGSERRLAAVARGGRIEEVASGLGAWPLGHGLYARGNELHRPGGGVIALRVEGEIVALAQDGHGDVLAGIKSTVYRIAKDHPSGEAPREFAAVQKGEIVRGGIAILAGKLAVTTTQGIQIFE